MSTPGSTGLADYVSKSDDNTTGYAFSLYNNEGTPQVGVVVGNGTTLEAVRINHTPTIGEWHHYAATWKASTKTMELFRDGVSLGTATGTTVSSIDDNTLPLRIGAEAEKDERNYDGKIDDVRIWNVVRTQSQIAANYQNALEGNESGLVAYYPFEDSNGNFILSDKTSNSNNLTNNGPFPSSSKAVSLKRSSGDYLQSSDSSSLSITGDFTIEAWLKPTSNPGSSSLADYVSKSDDNTSGYGFSLYNNNGIPQVGVVVGNGSTLEGVRINHTPTIGEWHHYAATWKASTKTMELFRDGVSLGTATGITVSSIGDNVLPLRIGAEAGSNERNYDGKIDDVRIWSVVRTQSQIAANYKNGLSGSESGLVAYYPFENSDGTFSLNDKTSNGNNLTNNDADIISNATDTVDNPFTTSTFGADFLSASSQYLSAPNNTTAWDQTGNFTVELWFKTTSDEQYLAQAGGFIDKNAGWSIHMTGGKPRFYSGRNTGTTQGTDYQYVDTTNALNDGSWHHVAYTYDGSNLKSYVDGSLDKIVSWSNNVVYPTTSYDIIGGRDNSGTVDDFYTGSIDEFRIWSTARSESEISNDKNVELTGSESGLAAYYPFETL